MKKEEVMKFIKADPDIMHGIPCIKGMRIPVAQIPSMLADGMTINQILKEYPSLSLKSIRAALKYASYACNLEIISL
jgi:uncharacterized protein (DUF433 family)